MLRYLVTKRYIEAVTVFSQDDDTLNGLDKLDQETIKKLSGGSKILINLPREFQRWNKHYREKNQQIQPYENEEKTKKTNNSLKKKNGELW